MLFVKYLLVTSGFGILLTAARIMVWDYLISRPRPLSIARGEEEPPGRGLGELSLRWESALRIAAIAMLPLLLGISITVVPGF